MSKKHTNALIEESSPYLLQHAHNPVAWVAWSDAVLLKAKEANKPLLISIGYAACHWCHVMEKECFEDESVAEIMNANFIPIKIDREERPDVDHIYMDALQMMTGSGGWPLNIIALPDGRPFWGATYLPKDQWSAILQQLTELYKEEPEKVIGYANKLAQGIISMNLVEPNKGQSPLSSAAIQEAVQQWSQYFDRFLGGHKRAPKFMMPANLSFLLHFADQQADKPLMDYVTTTLTRMAFGGIYDHVGGGFARYAVDTKWHVPHFEKMLYDNGQLISLYAQAYAKTKNELYRKVVEESIAFANKELMNAQHGYFSSLDADSINENGVLEEGAFFVWKAKDLKQLLGSGFELFKSYYNINSYGYWEHENYVLIRDASDAAVAEKHKISVTDLHTSLSKSLSLLKTERNKRARPGLDDKILSSWNGLMLSGLVDAYRYTKNTTYLNFAKKTAQFVLDHMCAANGAVWHNHKNGKSTINGYLEDYAALINGFIGLYEVSTEIGWLVQAQQWTNYCLEHFINDANGLFYFTAKSDSYVIRRTVETYDNVIPASNSIMAKNLFKLGKLLHKEAYVTAAIGMVNTLQEKLKERPESHANWLSTALHINGPFYEVAVVGENYKSLLQELMALYLPNCVFAAAAKDSTLALLQHRFQTDETLIYVCQHGSCNLPVKSVAEALKMIDQN